MLAIAIFLLLQATTTRSQESLQAVFEIANNSILLDETPFCERRSDSLTSCSLQCIRNKRCKSANFIKSEEMCSLMDKTRRSHPLLFLKQVTTVHLHKVWQINNKKKKIVKTVENPEGVLSHYLFICICKTYVIIFQ